MRRLVKRLSILVVLLLCVAVGLLAADVTQFLKTPLTPPAATTIVVEQGMSFADIMQRLEAKGVIKEPRYSAYLSIYARLTDSARKVKVGEYRIPAKVKPKRLLALLTSGDTVQYRITIIEGWTFAEMRHAIAAHKAIEHTLKGATAAQIMQRLGHPQQKAEGLFMPDTYFFPRGATDLSIYRRAYQSMQQFLQQAWAKRADDIAVDSPYETLILASIIQRETAVPTERKRISGVFTRRLEIGMRLQTDASVIYGIKNFHGNITSQDLRTDTPYNTYINAGLPPTPIALPGRASIVAALHPADGNALYFVAKDDGTHKFSATLAEHNRAVRKYQLN